MAVNFLTYHNIADTDDASPDADDSGTDPPSPHLHSAAATVGRRCSCSAGRPHIFSAHPDGRSPMRVRIEVGRPPGAPRAGYCGVVYFDVRPQGRRVAAGDCDDSGCGGGGGGGGGDPQIPRPQRWQRYLSAETPLELSFGPSPYGTRPWEFVCCLFTFADYLQLDCRLGGGGAVPSHEDVLLPWQLAAQPVWCAGLEELLLRGVAAAGRAEAPLRDPAGGTPLHRACTGPHKGALGYVKALLRKAGADCAARDDRGRTALHCAAEFSGDGGGGGGSGVVSATEYGRAVDVLSFLVDEAGADLRAADACGETALHCAARCDVEPCAMVATLLRGGACTSVVDVRGLTPLGAARSLGAFHTASALELWRPDSGGPRPKEGGVPKRQLVEAFAAFDKNKTGFIGYSDFKHLEQRFINEYGIGVGANLIQSAISKYGLLVDGKLSYNAFAMLITLIP